MNYSDHANGKNLAIAERRRMAFNLRKTGLSYQEVADEIAKEIPPDLLPDQYGAWWASQDVAWVLDKLRSDVSESAADVIALENSRLDAMLAALWPAILKGNARSTEVALKIMERRSRMLGLDEAIKVDWRVEIGGLIAAGLVSREEARDELGDELWAIMSRHLAEIEEGDIATKAFIGSDHRTTTAGDKRLERRSPHYQIEDQLPQLHGGADES